MTTTMYELAKKLDPDTVGDASPFVALLTMDEYFLRMAQTDFLADRKDTIMTKSFFIRKAPFGGAYCIAFGITEALRKIELLCNGAIDHLTLWDICDRKFLKYLMKGTKDIQVEHLPEGTIFFPHEPVLTVSGPICFVRLIEGLVTWSINNSSLFGTKWSRMVRVGRNISEFSLRRAQDPIRNTVYGFLAGVNTTSNMWVKKNLPEHKTTGTMGHEWIMTSGDELEEFDLFVKHNV